MQFLSAIMIPACFWETLHHAQAVKHVPLIFQQQNCMSVLLNKAFVT